MLSILICPSSLFSDSFRASSLLHSLAARCLSLTLFTYLIFLADDTPSPLPHPHFHPHSLSLYIYLCPTHTRTRTHTHPNYMSEAPRGEPAPSRPEHYFGSGALCTLTACHSSLAFFCSMNGRRSSRQECHWHVGTPSMARKCIAYHCVPVFISHHSPWTHLCNPSSCDTSDR